MTEERKKSMARILIGGILGTLVGLVLVPYVMYSRECPPLAVLACAALGGMAGLATQPFADSGRALLLRSAGTFSGTVPPEMAGDFAISALCPSIVHGGSPGAAGH